MGSSGKKAEYMDETSYAHKDICLSETGLNVCFSRAGTQRATIQQTSRGRCLAGVPKGSIWNLCAKASCHGK